MVEKISRALARAVHWSAEIPEHWRRRRSLRSADADEEQRRERPEPLAPLLFRAD